MFIHARKYLAALVAIFVATSSFANADARPPKRFQSEIPTPRVDYWQKRQAEIVEQINGTRDLSPVKLVFIGDSITDFWHLDENPWFKGKWMGRAVWDESFGETSVKNHAINIGISGDRIEHVLYRLTPSSESGLGMLDRSDLQPEFLIIMLGINNTFDGEEPLSDSLFQGVKAAMDRAHATKPSSKIILQSILPTDDPTKNDQVVKVVNKRLKELASHPRYSSLVTYLDLYSGFVDAAGAQRKDLFVDGLHPGREGYRVWRDLLIPSLERARARI